ncbi:MAG: phosphoribosylformylglycinamidine cyclo-ligase [Acidimicrobiia bacterium]|nr:phosphoribosylformylglycinamidine cyclo-ligase [Acidimicrobiia bacterium]MCY4456801.1 phosphoribosylformylglycinamidine cyclo-ligase [Acidimicrobiaceae bacterium]
MSNYREAGVDIDAANLAVEGMVAAVSTTKTEAVLSEIGAFGGLFAADSLGTGKVLVASTDGVGTKTLLATEMAHYRSLGVDLVNHCVNDILVQGARPLFFLDYIATAKVVPQVVVKIVEGICAAAKEVRCAVLGGETAEMPGVYLPGATDIAGTIVGVVNRDELLPQTERLCNGDLLLGLPSDSPHTNGYALIRALLEHHKPSSAMLEFLLTPHRCYLGDVDYLAQQGVKIKAMAHITGGGVIENLPRVLPAGLAAQIDLSAWPVPEGFRTLVDWGTLSDDEAFRVWNMGVGMILVVDQTQADLLDDLGLLVLGSLHESERSAADARVRFTGTWR